MYSHLAEALAAERTKDMRIRAAEARCARQGQRAKRGTPGIGGTREMRHAVPHWLRGLHLG